MIARCFNAISQKYFSATVYFRKMSVFTQVFNPISGKNEWVMQHENYDYYQEVARSAYADMLHDTERNHKYYLAIKKAISTMQKRGLPANVLDIGTGAGLLSMMAAHSGADSIIACEAFDPIAACALDVIKENGLTDRIKVIPKRSTQLTVGHDGDMQQKANILVTEVFDTELIGEGALGTFRHALECLLEPDCIVVPSAAVVYAQIVESSLISKFHKLENINIRNNMEITVPSNIRSCEGLLSAHDIQMSELPKDSFSLLMDKHPVFMFDFTGQVEPLEMERTCMAKVPCIKSGQCDAVFMWWELKMDMDGDIILSCAPSWAHPVPHELQWRDHWMQAIYKLPETIPVNKGDDIYLYSCHDEYNMWFHASQSIKADGELLPPICRCRMHSNNSRGRIGMLNDSVRNKKYVQILKKIITSSSVCLSVGDCSLLPLIAAKLGAEKVIVAESSGNLKPLKAYVAHNQLQNKVVIFEDSIENVVENGLLNQKVDILLSEPYFTNNVLPWDALYFWYLKMMLNPVLKPTVKVVPQRAVIRCVAVEFQDLHKIRAPVCTAEDFNLEAFDKIIQAAITISDALIEPHYLWEYPCKPLTDVIDLIHFDFTTDVLTDVVEAAGSIAFTSEGRYNGVALWMDFGTDDVTITTGPKEHLLSGKFIVWDMYSRQGVYFVPRPIYVKKTHIDQLYFKVVFNPNNANVNFSFDIKTEENGCI